MLRRSCFLIVGLSLLTCSTSAFAGPFGRRGGCSGGSCGQQVVQQPQTQHVQAALPEGCHTATAQGVANIMAHHRRVGHWGGNRGYEGCGCGATPTAAYSICCYGNSGMATIDVGYAKGADGMWYCCRRYR